MSEIADLRRARGYVKAKLTRLRTRVTQANDGSGIEFDKEQAEVRDFPCKRIVIKVISK